MKAACKGEAGFTLVELLVVLAIVAILAALLLPAISHGQQKAQQIRCVGNLHQLGVGLQSFVAENHAYPSPYGPRNSENPGSWIIQLQRSGLDRPQPVTNLLKEGVWRCPRAPEKLAPPHTNRVFCSYGYNTVGVTSGAASSGNSNALGLAGNYTPGAGFAPLKESEVVAPADMMAIGDSIVGASDFSRDNLAYLDQNGRATARHQGRVNVVFCDSHVESPTLTFTFEDTIDLALVRWNRDHQPHREMFSATP